MRFVPSVCAVMPYPTPMRTLCAYTRCYPYLDLSKKDIGKIWICSMRILANPMFYAKMVECIFMRTVGGLHIYAFWDGKCDLPFGCGKEFLKWGLTGGDLCAIIGAGNRKSAR